MAWTVLPLLIVFVIFLVITRTVVSMRSEPSPGGSLLVRVVGHQWWWTFEYPQQHFATANEMHVPVSRGPAQSAFLQLESGDVVDRLGAPVGGEDGPDFRPGEHDVVRSREEGRIPRAVWLNIAACSTA